MTAFDTNERTLGTPASARSGGDGLMSDATRIAAGAAFEELARSLAPAPDGERAGERAGSRGEALEALVKDAMRPLLREWIDANLQTIVEGVVREEIARLTKGR